MAILAALGTDIRREREIQSEIKEAEMYSIPLDETFVVRYLHHMQIQERFIEVCDVDTATGQELVKDMLSLLQKNGVENMCDHGYDGAANMSAMYKCLPARIRTQ